MFLIGFLLIIALPFVTRYILEERFYKVQVDEIYNKVYNYSDVYQYIAEITNIGKRNIAGCVFSHQILYDTSKDSGFVKYKHMLLNYVKPRHIYNKDIPMQLDVGQSVKISQVMEDYPHRNEPFVTKIECYGKGKAEQNEKVLVGYKKPPAETSEATESSAPENAESSASNTTQDSKDSNIPKEPFNAPSSNIESSTQNVETSTQNPQDSNINANIESNLQNIESSAPNPSNVTPNTESNIESNTESNIESSTPSSPPQNPQNPQDSTPDNSIDLQNSQEAQEEAKREEERKRREERDNFNVPMLKEAPR